MSVLGIDFGTSYSSASFVNADGKPEAIRFSGNDMKMPSLVSFFNNAQPSVGYDVDWMLRNGFPAMSDVDKRKFMSSLVKSIKRSLKPNGVECGHSHRQVVALVLNHIREESDKACAPKHFDELVLTHPVQFEEWKKNLLIDAAREAGFKKVELLEEPVSAAIGYLCHESVENVRGMLVYDFGAGTFDVAYVTKHEGRFIVPIPPKGDSRCGGDDIDNAIYEYVTAKSAHTMGDEFTKQRDLNLLLSCRSWKERLSTMASVPIGIQSKLDLRKRYSETFEQRMLESLALPFIDRTVKLTKEVYDEVKENRLPLDFILLIGGSSQMPLISKRLNAVLPGVNIRTTGTVDIAVALGASYYSINPVEVNPEKEWCYCMYDGRKILKSYNFCIYCGKPNFYKTKKF